MAEQAKSPKPVAKSAVRVFRIPINPLWLLVGILLTFFLISALANQGMSTRSISVDEFLRNLENNQYSRIEIRDSGEVLAQDKYVLVANIDSTKSLNVAMGTKIGSLGKDVKKITLEELLAKLTPVDPLAQLRSMIGNGKVEQVEEVLVADNFIVIRTVGNESPDYFIDQVDEVDFRSAIKAAGIDLTSLGTVITYLRTAAQDVPQSEIAGLASKGELTAVYDLNGKYYARIRTAAITTYSLRWDGGITNFAATLQREGISLASSNFEIGSVLVSSINWGDIISLVTLVGFIILAIFLFRGIQGSGNSLMRFGQSKARMFWGVKPDITFKDVAGIDEAKQELEEIVKFLKEPAKFQKLGARIPKGVLMVGAPGTGKTLLARAIAGEAGVPFFHTSGSEFEEMLVGAGASRVRDLFDKAKRAAPALIFIDEIDAVARKRGTTVQSSTTEQTLNQILVEMDGFEQGTNVIVIAATNRPDVLDPAILRPGRFDRRVVLDLPDIEGRKQILAIHAKNKPLADDVDLERVAKRTTGFSGAELENTLNEAAIIAAKEDRKQITAHDIEEAATKVTMGPAKQNRRRTEEELKLVAVHEAGHAVVAKFLPQVDPVHRVSIISRGMAGGVTHFLPQDDSRIVSKTKLMSRLVVALGGRAAEEIVLNDISTGASNDIDQATNVARSMVQKFGMSEKLGLIKYGESNELQYLGYGYGEQRDYSDDTAKLIDEEVRKLMQDAYDKARDLIKKNRAKFDELVAMLLKQEVVEAEEFDALFKK